MRHEPAIASGTSTVVSTTSGRLTPSTPTLYWTPNERTQLACCPSWKPASPVRNRAARATARPRVTRLASRATQRTARSSGAAVAGSPGPPEALALGMAATSRAPASGANTVRVSSTAGLLGGPEDEEGDDQHRAAEHANRVGAHEARLEPAAAAGDGADRLGRAVDGAVDGPLVHVHGQEGGQRPAERDGEELVDVVDVELVGEQAPCGRVADPQRGPLDPAREVDPPGGERPDRGGADRGQAEQEAREERPRLLGRPPEHGLEEAPDRADAREAAEDAPDQCEDREDEQRDGHDGRRLVGVAAARPARLAEEGEEVEPGHVEGGEPGGEHADHPGEQAGAPVRERGAEDRLLGEEPGGEREADDREPGRPHGEERDRHGPAQAAEPLDVGVVVVAVHHRPGAEEQLRLEEEIGRAHV